MTFAPDHWIIRRTDQDFREIACRLSPTWRFRLMDVLERQLDRMEAMADSRFRAHEIRYVRLSRFAAALFTTHEEIRAGALASIENYGRF